jgi:cytochrome P450
MAPMTLPLRTAAFWQDPYPLLDEAREHDRTAVSESGEPVTLSIDDLETVSAHPMMAPLGLDALDRLGITEGPFREWRRLSLNAQPGDDHTRLRALVGRAFTPRQVQRVRPLVREHAHRLLDAVAGAGEMDVIADYAHDIPLYGICTFLGIDEADRDEIQAFMVSTDEGFSWPMTDERKERANAGIVALYEYVDRLVQRRRRDPGDDLVSALVNVEEAGDRLTPDELRAMVVNIIGGAVGSSEAAISNAAYLFSAHPDQAQIVRDDPSIDRDVVEECLRYAPPFRSTRRKALAPLDVVGVHLEVDDTILVSRQAANRDPARFAEPHRFDVRRGDHRHAAFGHGPHFCLGQALARANLTEAIPIMVRRCDELEVTTDPIRREPFGPTERFEELRVRFVARTRDDLG